MTEDLKTSDEWLAEPQYEGITVLDPDGWDRKNFKESWNEKISENEFGKRLAVSTVQIHPNAPILNQNS